jgi:Holliday junction resolvase RusA-like endonuclease
MVKPATTTKKKGKNNSKTKEDKERMLSHFKFTPSQPNQLNVASSKHISTLTCKIIGVPRAQARCFATTTASSKKVCLINQSKEYCESFRNAVLHAIAASQKEPFNFNLSHPVKIKVRFFFSRPRSHYRQVNKKWVLAENCPTYVTKIPDIDNLLKLLLDALQGVCYSNDMTVAHIDSAKLFDPTQLEYKKEQVGGGCTIIQISEINQSEAETGCDCLSCKAKLKRAEAQAQRAA